MTQRHPEAIFVNGIQTEIIPAKEHAERLGKMTGLWVKSFYNDKDSFIQDLAECFYSRFLVPLGAKPRPITRRLADEIAWQMDHIGGGKPFYLFAHSQGCMLVMNALAILPEFYRRRCRVFLFAVTNLYQADGLGHCEYFLNEDDFVVANLVIGQLLARLWRRAVTWWTGKTNNRGPLYMARGGGHSFDKAYLDRIQSFGGYHSSMFHQLTKGQRP